MWKWVWGIALYGVLAPTGALGLVGGGALVVSEAALHRGPRHDSRQAIEALPSGAKPEITVMTAKTDENQKARVKAAPRRPDNVPVIDVSRAADSRIAVTTSRVVHAAEAQSPPAHVLTSGGSAGAAPPVVSSPRVFIHYRLGSTESQTAAGRIASSLQRFGFELVQIRTVQDPPHNADIRYFFQEDAAAARQLARDLSRADHEWSVRSFTSYGPKPRHGTIEIWIPSP